MKKSRLQVLIEFASQLSRIRATRNGSAKGAKKYTKASVIAAFVLLSFNSNAITYFSRNFAANNWNATTSWSTVAYGNATNTGTYPKPGDIANIGNGYTIYINANLGCATLNVGTGASGILEYRSTGNYTLTITGNILVNTGARFRYNTATNHTHGLLVGGNFTNLGNVDFYYAANQIVNMTFNTATNSVVSGNGSWDLNTVTMNKSTSTATQLSVSANLFEVAMRTFVGTYGTYIHNNTGTFTVLPSNTTFTIGPNTIYKVPTGTMWFSRLADNVVLQGALYCNGGNVNIGSTAGNQGLRTDQNGTTIPYLEVSGGTMTVYGGITYLAGSTNEPFRFKIKVGTLLLNSGTTGTNKQVFCVTDVANSSFIDSSGTIILQKPNTLAATNIDFQVCGASGTVISAGTGLVQFGNTLTPTGKIFNFKPFANATLPHFKVTGTAAALITLATSANSTANFKLRSLYIDIGKTFDIRSITGTMGDTKQMTLLGAANGSGDAIYNCGTFTARQSTVTFNTSGAQCIGGLNVTTFYILAINNASHITLNKAANVANYLSMVNGRLKTTNTNILTCLNGGNASLGSNASFVEGPMVHTLATAASTTKAYPIGNIVGYRPVLITLKHTNATSVTYRAEIINSPASALPYTKPVTIANVSAVRYVKFTRQAVANFTSGRIQMFYDLDDLVLDKNTLLVAHDDGVSMWQNFGGTATANGVGNILSNLFTNFHTYFALGNPPGGGNPLPITLTSFTATPENKKVILKWTTVAEVNNDHFTIERSADNVNFTTIATIAGAGNSTSTINYSTIDEQPLTGTSYYRMTQTDFDGMYQRFPVVSVYIGVKGTFEVYPTLTNGSHIHLRCAESDLKGFQVSVRDIQGRTIPSTVSYADGLVELNVDETYRKNGAVYFVTATDGVQNLNSKFVISEN